MNSSKFSIPARLAILRSLVPVMILVGILFCMPLWAGNRDFPKIPLNDAFNFPVAADASILVLLILALMAMVVSRYARLIYLVVLCCSVLLVLSDLNRLQGWFVIFQSILFLVISDSGRLDDEKSHTTAFASIRLVVVSVYFLSSLSRINGTFAEDEINALLSPLQAVFSERQLVILMRPLSLAPYILIFCGIGFLIPPIRFLALGLALVMHFALCVFLPMQQIANYSLAFANLGYIFILLALFYDTSGLRTARLPVIAARPSMYVIVIVFIFLPLSHEMYGLRGVLSFRDNVLYRNRTILIDDNVYSGLGLYERSFCHADKNKISFAYQAWGRHILRGDCLPGEEIRQKVSRSLAGNSQLKNLPLNSTVHTKPKNRSLVYTGALFSVK
jgi:uncharacterized membrane protein